MSSRAPNCRKFDGIPRAALGKLGCLRTTGIFLQSIYFSFPLNLSWAFLGNCIISSLRKLNPKRPYSQTRACLAIAWASLLAMLRSPTSVVFSLLFPVIFIVVFGSMVNNADIHIKLGIAGTCDTSNVIYKNISKLKIIDLVTDTVGLDESLRKGRLTAILDIRKKPMPFGIPGYRVNLLSSNSAVEKLPLLQSVLGDIINQLNSVIYTQGGSVAELNIQRVPGRQYRQIDFILPGQLGFSLLMAGVFGSAFLLFNLRQGLVLKRFFATPISRSSLIFGEALSRLFFQVISFIVMVGLGYYAFNFTLIHGLLTFLEMIVLSIFGLVIFTGIGFIISGLLENESSIAPVANTITLPQILLCGLFFPIENYPHALQSFCKMLPLTFFVDGQRKIAFEGTHIWQMPTELLGLTVWTLIIGLITIRVFKWE